MPESADLVRYELKGPVALLTLDNPPVNVVSIGVLEHLVARLAEVEAEPRARVVVLASASDKAFGAGANIKEMAPLTPPEAARHGARGQAATVALERLPMPVIAAVNGSALGGGCELALACDLILASEDARFGQPEINLGLMPGWGGTQRLPRWIGPAQARYWIMTGRPVTAREAEAMGLVLKVVPKAELLASALALAEELAGKSATALAAIKLAVNHAIAPGRDRDLAYELELWQQLFATADQKEGMRAFLEKRPWTPAPRNAAGGNAKN
jgi:enoyl-CoA hydratase